MPDDLGDAWDEFRRRSAAGAAGYPTGYSVDARCGKWRPGELALLWARAGIGKTTLVMNMVARSPEVSTVIFTLEMPPYRLLEWLLPIAVDLPVDQRDLEHVAADPAHPQHGALMDAGDLVRRVYPTLHILQLPRPTVADLGLRCDEIEDETGVKPQRVFIDHLALLGGYSSDKASTDALTSALKSWCTSRQLTACVVQQTGRSGGEGTRNDGHLPVTLSSGVYGGEADADWILGAFRPDRDPKYRDDHSSNAYLKVKNTTMLQVVKNRPYGTLCEQGIPLRFQETSRRLLEDGVSWTPPTSEAHP